VSGFGKVGGAMGRMADGRPTDGKPGRKKTQRFGVGKLDTKEKLQKVFS
jgi:hypothetical protein